MKKQTPISVRGIVIAAAWTPRGDVTEIDIAGCDEMRYRVVNDATGVQLRDHIKKSVVVEGVVRPKKGGLTIIVKRFRINRSGNPQLSAAKNIAPSI